MKGKSTGRDKRLFRIGRLAKLSENNEIRSFPSYVTFRLVRFIGCAITYANR